MFRRRLSAALTLGAALVAVTACSSPATPSAAPTTTAASMPAPAQVVGSIKSAVAGSTAVHMKGNLVLSGSAVGLDLQLSKDGSASGTISEGGATVPLIVVNKVLYMQFNSNMLSQSGLSPTSDAGKLLLNKWVPSTSQLVSRTKLSDLSPLLDYQALLTDALNQAGSEVPKAAGTETVDGVDTHAYTFGDGTRINIASSSPHYPIRLTAPKAQGPGQVDFTNWSQPVKISLPASADMYSGPGA
jgi:hypothetical protein